MRPDGSAVLIDFGAAQSSWDAGVKPDAMAVYTPSYAALEVRSGNAKLGPWSDFYSLGAVIFRCMTGTSPPSAEARLNDVDVVDVDKVLDSLLAKWSTTLVETARWMLRLPIEERTSRAEDVLQALTSAAGEEVNSLTGAHRFRRAGIANARFATLGVVVTRHSRTSV